MKCLLNLGEQSKWAYHMGCYAMWARINDPSLSHVGKGRRKKVGQMGPNMTCHCVEVGPVDG